MHTRGLVIVETDVAEFVVLHRAHGPLVGELQGPQTTSPRFVVACACGVVFERRVTGDEPLENLVGALMRGQRVRAGPAHRAA